MSGHLFITRGDITRLHCDGRLIPSGLRGSRHGHVLDHWELGPAGFEFVDGVRLAAQPPTETERVVPLLKEPPETLPGTWIAHTGAPGHEDDPAWFVRPVIEFLQHAAHALPHAPVTKRAKPLLAFPLVRTGDGGIGADKGGLLKELTSAVRDELRRLDADAVLVARNRQAFAAASHLRSEEGDSWWSELDTCASRDSIFESARELGREARRDRLVLFIGAGVSAAAGLPSWKWAARRA